MAEADLALLERLVRSSTWREYREQVLLMAYGRVAQALDVAQSDHRYLQGLKEGLRLAMVEPYRLLGLPSPLDTPLSMTKRAHDSALAQASAQARAQAPMEDDLRPQARPSYLA